jgi:N-acetylneuraminate synthase
MTLGTMNICNARNVFDGLFVLEMANNHWGSVERGLKIISDYQKIVRFNNVRAAIKLQLRDVESFIHEKYLDRDDIRYIKKTKDTRLTFEDYAVFVRAIKGNGCIAMATPFDEQSVDDCVSLGISILKIASSDINDWPLIEKIAATRLPVSISTGGSSVKDIDDIVSFFSKREIPLALNHCVSLYPTEDYDLELNQIDYLRDKYPEVVIGFSTHEYHDWSSSVMMAYAKGARTFERHVDIDQDGIPISPYCSLPHQVDEWFKAWIKAREMCGAPGTQKRIPKKDEVGYLNTLLRGVYARRDLPKDYVFTKEDLNDAICMKIPLLKGQISCRELMTGERILRPIREGEPVMIDDIDSPYSDNEHLKSVIYKRGL